MNWFRELSLRNQLLLLAILLTLPSLVIIIFNGLKERSDALKRAAAETRKLTDSIAAEQEHLTHEALQLGKLIAQLPDVKQHNIPKVRSILANILKDNPQYHSILISDNKGNVWASSDPLHRHISIADRSCFQSTLASHSFSSGEYILSKINNKPTLSMCYPAINEQGKFDGVITLSFNLDQLKTLLERSQLPNDANYVITDCNGIIISRGHDNDGKVGSSIKHDALKDMEDGPDELTYDYVRYDGDKRITTYRKLWLSGEQKPYVYIRSGISFKTAIANSNREIMQNIKLLLPFVVIAFSLAFIIGNRSIAGKISVLKSAAQLLAQGHYPGKIADIVKGGELGSLGQAFDEMSQQLNTRERALQASETWFRALFEDAGDYILVLAPPRSSNENTVIIDANHAACDIHGYCREELLGEPITLLEDPAYWKKSRSCVKLEKPGDFCMLETVHVRKNGSTFPVEASLRMIQIDDMPPIVLAIERDITMRKQAEEELRQALDTAKTTSDTMNRLLRTIAHEFRTPLGLLTGCTDILERYWDRMTPDKRFEQTELIRSAAHQLSTLINAVTSFDHLGTDKAMNPPAALDIGEICRVIAAEVETVWGAGHDYSVIIDADCGTALLNEMLFRSMLENLLTNSFRYTPPDGTVSLHVRREKDRLLAEVIDTGIGIPDEDQKLIFEAFYRSRNVERRRGLGLGLSIVRDALSQLGGTITVASKIGEGTTMRVELPV